MVIYINSNFTCSATASRTSEQSEINKNLAQMFLKTAMTVCGLGTKIPSRCVLQSYVACVALWSFNLFTNPTTYACLSHSTLAVVLLSGLPIIAAAGLCSCWPVPRPLWLSLFQHQLFGLWSKPEDFTKRGKA